MNYTRRAFVSICRNLKKTIIFFLLVILLCTVIGATIFVNQAVANTEENLLNLLPPTATVREDMEKVNAILSDTGTWPDMTLTPDQIRRIAALPYVRDYDFFSNMPFYSSSLVPYTRQGTPTETRFGYLWWVRGVQNPNIHDIQEGHIELVYGRTFTTSEVNELSFVALISEDVATENNLRIGSFISLNNVVVSWEVEDEDGNPTVLGEKSYDLEIIGIFRPLISADTVDILSELDNRIYTPNLFVEMANRFAFEIQADEDYLFELDGNHITSYRNFFILHSSHDLPAFREAATHGIPRHFVVYDAGNPFQGIASSMETMVEMAFMVLYLTVGAAIIVLSLLITLFLHDRKKEIGIYLSVGVSKSQILLQFVLEVVVIAMIGITVALFIGRFASEILSHNMLMGGIDLSQDSGFIGFGLDPLMQMGFQVDIGVGDLMTGYRFNFDSQLVRTFFTVGIGITILSTIVPMIYVLKQDPKKIMM